jgi:hypothetical protein
MLQFDSFEEISLVSDKVDVVAASASWIRSKSFSIICFPSIKRHLDSVARPIRCLKVIHGSQVDSGTQ